MRSSVSCRFHRSVFHSKNPKKSEAFHRYPKPRKKSRVRFQTPHRPRTDVIFYRMYEVAGMIMVIKAPLNVKTAFCCGLCWGCCNKFLCHCNLVLWRKPVTSTKLVQLPENAHISHQKSLLSRWFSSKNPVSLVVNPMWSSPRLGRFFHNRRKNGRHFCGLWRHLVEQCIIDGDLPKPRGQGTPLKNMRPRHLFQVFGWFFFLIGTNHHLGKANSPVIAGQFNDPCQNSWSFSQKLHRQKNMKKALSTLSPKLVFDDGDLFLQLLLTKILTKMIFCYKALQNS